MQRRVLIGREEGRNFGALMSSSLKEMKNGAVSEGVRQNGHGGGVKDLYGEDSATEDQLITPWTFSVAR